jgi:hypothetical protein
MAPASTVDRPVSWSNQDIVVYHGTVNTYVPALTGRAVSVSAGQRNTDFGPGFYTTTLFPQAENWAKRITRGKSGTRPVVVEYAISREALGRLDALAFVRGHDSADDLWSLIRHCRSGGLSHRRTGTSGCYDLVYGPVAMDWKQKIAAFDGDQISFHTAAAESVLNQRSGRRILKTCRS